jgi:CHAT domain-containing protein/tetratricopeptide (TPR) repeat protein
MSSLADILLRRGRALRHLAEFTFLAVFLLSFAVPCGAQTAAPAAQAAPIAQTQSAPFLDLGKPIERELRGGESHSYRIRLEAGQYLHVVVEQKGIDVVVSLDGPDGKTITESDSPNGIFGPEPLSAIAAASGDHVIRVHSDDKNVAAGKYEIRLTDLRAPKSDDHTRISAERAFMEAAQLQAQGTADFYRQALAKWEESLPLWQSIADSGMQGSTLHNLGLVRLILSENRKALEYYNRALPILRAAGDRAGEAMTLNDIGAAYLGLGEWQKALVYLNQALPIFRAIGDRADEAATLSNMGSVYDTLGDKQKALEYFNQGLQILHAVGDRAGEATILNNIGRLYDDLGEKQKALEYLNQALPIHRAVGNRTGEAATLNNVGLVYDALGEKQKALDYYAQALPIRRATGDRFGEAVTLNNIGKVYGDLGEKQKALEYYNQALPIRRTVGDRSGEADTLGNIGSVYDALGEKRKALEYHSQALLIFRAVGARSREAVTLTNIGGVYDALGEKQKALAHYNRALVLQRAVRNPMTEGRTLTLLTVYWESERNTRVAIFFGKQAVNCYQQIRGNILGLDKSTQQSLVASVHGIYRKLAALLISEGRLAEAEQVLNLLKLEEYDEFTRRSGSAASSRTAPLALTPEEAETDKHYREISAESTAIGEEWSQLRAKKERTPEEEQRLTELSAKLEAANDAFIKFLEGLTAQLGKTQARIVEKEVSGIQKVLRNLDPGAVALYTLVGEEKLQIIVVTPEVMQAREVSISAKDLRAKVFAFRQTLLNSHSDPLPAAQELYRIILAPVARDLDGAHATTLMWSLDDVLRYIPISALHDGKQFVVEKYRNEVFTPASIPQLQDRANVASWRGLGFGISKSYAGLAALPAVPVELRGIIREQGASSAQGVLPGSVLLDDDFTTANFERALEQNSPVVHIASHFAFRPGNETDSFLLLGGKDPGGERLTLAQIRRDPRIFFRETQVLTLSACDTATSGEARGKEVDGLGYLLEEKGAKSVVATLWPVADASTGILMQKFYKGWTGASPVSKAEALRQAQLSLLRRAKAGSVSFAHPYFWAPFILIGNWR